MLILLMSMSMTVSVVVVDGEVVQVREHDLLGGDPRRGPGADVRPGCRRVAVVVTLLAATPAPSGPAAVLFVRPDARAARGVSSLTASSCGSVPILRSANGDRPSSSLYIGPFRLPVTGLELVDEFG